MQAKHFILMILTTLVSGVGTWAQEQGSPNAEFTKAYVILMHTPGHELYDGVIHPAQDGVESYTTDGKARADFNNLHQE